MPDNRKYIDYSGLTLYDSKLKKWVADQLKNQETEQKNADWNENDISSPSYVKNRTHYKEPEYWTFTDFNTKYGYYSQNTEGNDINPDMFVYEVSVDGGDFVDVCPAMSFLTGWKSFGNLDYNVECVDPFYKKWIDSIDSEAEANFSIIIPDSNRIIFSTDNNDSHTVRIRSTERKIPFLENRYAYLNGELYFSGNIDDLEEGQIFDVEIDNEIVPLTVHKMKMSVYGQ